MGIVLWIVFALLIAMLLVYLTSLRTRQLLPPVEMLPGEKFPRTPLQRLSGWTLALVGLLTAFAAGLVAYHGPQVWWDSDPVRLTVTFILLVGLMVYLVFTLVVRSLEKREDGSYDERDSAIMARSSAGVGGAMMVIVAVWMVALTETFRETHLVPSYYLYLIFWSCVMTNVLASVAGILLAYRRR